MDKECFRYTSQTIGFLFSKPISKVSSLCYMCLESCSCYCYLLFVNDVLRDLDCRKVQREVDFSGIEPKRNIFCGNFEGIFEAD